MTFKQSTKICFTIPQKAYNDISVFDDIYKNHSDQIRYLIVGQEWSINEYPHYQGYIQLFKQMRKKQFQKMFRYKCHMEHQRGSNEEARNYCWKGQYQKKGTIYPQPSAIIKEYGVFCEGQGKRTEMEDIKELLTKGITHYEIVNKDTKYFHSYARYHNFYEKYKNWADNERLNTMRKPIDTYVIWGDCATGKTQSIYNKYGVKNCYCLSDPNGDNKNWNGYQNQKILIIDDFYSWIKLNNMLRITDNKPYRIRQLMGYRWAQWEKVYITSNCDPNKWYPNMRYNNDMHKSMEAFYSRIKKCIKVTRGNTNALVTTNYDIRGYDRHTFKEYLKL